ncbi:hypothetical protein WJ0W_003007 [Paenibacillus melissococcoides]|uniref:Uncharacterized protein n=1 Tax=Paenibacillus melissococcoides TaxID=2912268 RepID=A0ABN8U3Y7_9BACL|nr:MULTISPECIES: hypothetical protein [Paenibacillus]MEB9896118.1 hypothetical protein [Bacillus cereus]CAH8245772.1 hypothetical protein WJ0W_003007 [Paenibacillus melissococcoides]CAH8712040.1 hypothetical protein WDD9_003095 [Paenibacillus melissococcoides]CAH8712783.1 hypothetical protein HTL2_003397 [Paenibacillus melissococcoides]GIO78033.1 hypothetical protein J6TS7_16430 [Paenibacillus dendritiformis]
MPERKTGVAERKTGVTPGRTGKALEGWAKRWEGRQAKEMDASGCRSIGIQLP